MTGSSDGTPSNQCNENKEKHVSALPPEALLNAGIFISNRSSNSRGADLRVCMLPIGANACDRLCFHDLSTFFRLIRLPCQLDCSVLELLAITSNPNLVCNA